MSVYLVPYLRTLLLKKHVVEKAQDDHSATDDEHEMFDSQFYSAFRKAVNWCVKYRWVTSVRTELISTPDIVGMSKVQQ